MSWMVQYPGYMEPWAVVEEANPITAPGFFTAFFDDDSVEYANSDGSYESSAQPWEEITTVTLIKDDEHDFTVIHLQDEPELTHREAFDGYDIYGIDLLLISEHVVVASDDPDESEGFAVLPIYLEIRPDKPEIDAPDLVEIWLSAEDDPALEFVFDPWSEVAAGTVTDFPDYQLIISIEDEDPVFEYAIDPWAVVEEAITDFPENRWDVANDDDDPFAEFAFEPWSEVFMEVADFEEFLVIEDDDATLEYSFDGFDTTADAPHFESGFTEQDEFLLFEAAMEPWVDALVHSPDFDSVVLVDEPDGVVHEFECRGDIISVTIIEFPDFDHAFKANDDDDPYMEFSYEPWTEQSSADTGQLEVFNIGASSNAFNAGSSSRGYQISPSERK